MMALQKKSPILDSYGKPFKTNGKPRKELLDALNAGWKARQKLRRAGQPEGRANLSYDAARDGDTFQNYWSNADSLDADTANNPRVRQKLRDRSRYEYASNGYYHGILQTHVNMLIGVGPTLRMLTQNADFNEMVERAFWEWSQRINWRRKLWCLAHAFALDGEGFAILQTNPAAPDGDVQLDLQLIEAEQVTTPYMPFRERGYIDGIRFDDFNNVLWYDVLPEHPGSGNGKAFIDKPVRVAPTDMLHWFLMERPGQHRGVPLLASTLNLGASRRRYTEAVVTGAETLANFSLFLESPLPPDQMPAVEPSIMDMVRQMMVALPQGTKAFQPKAEQPSAEYVDFHRTLISEQARPLSMPYNAAACDSSTYSFASGKLDMLCYRATIDTMRQDCNDLVLDRLFGAWFREWQIVNPGPRLRDSTPRHQWDWPAHPVIDAVAEAEAKDKNLKNGTLSLREAYTQAGFDYAEQLAVQAEDYFGESSEENIQKMRQIHLLTNFPNAAAILMPQSAGQQEGQPNVQAA